MTTIIKSNTLNNMLITCQNCGYEHLEDINCDNCLIGEEVDPQE